MVEEYLEAWDYYREILEEAVPVEDQVVVCVRSEARGSASQVTIEQRQGEIHTLRDKQIVRVDLYPSYEDALAAVGLNRTSARESAGFTESGGTRAFSRRRWRR
jgi:hypothetical protein